MKITLPRLKLPTARKKVTEDSVELRAWVLAAVLVGEVAVLTSGYLDLTTGLLVPLLTVAAFVVSHNRRAEKNFYIKVLLAFGALAALAMFFREVLSSLYDTRVPLARLFLWVQVLHSFDLPARKDLSYSLVSGLILLSAGAVLSTSLFYGLFVLSFFACALGALVQLKLSEARERAGTVESRGLTLGIVAPGFLAAVAVGILCFSLMPQNQSMNLTMMPTSAFQNLRGDFSGSVQNPYYKPPPGGDPFAGPPQNIAPDSYHGFNPYMDLRSRGRLSDEVVMKVRSEEAVPYRGVVFDEYNGKGWQISTGDKAETLTSDGPRFDMFTARHTEPLEGPTRQVAQVYHVERDASNVIFGAYRPETVFFPTSSIKADPYNSLRAPYEIPSGSTYSIISRLPNSSPARLRAASKNYPGYIADKYTELPASSLARTRALARRLTQDTDNPYDAVTAMNDYLKKSYPYDLSIPPQQEKMDAVEYFLFEQKRGYCEQFASSLAVMARSQGIPARVATGYVSGEYNPFTGLYEVKASDAHAWVEVYFPGYGWSTFDPTPGFDSTPWQYQQQEIMQGSKVFGFLAGKTGEALAPALGAIGTLMRGIARLDPASIIIAGLALVGVSMLAAYSRRYIVRRRRKPQAQRSVKVSDARIYSRYKSLTESLERAGFARERHQTPEEYARQTAERMDEPAFARLGEIYLYARFRDTIPSNMADEFDRLEPLAAASIERLEQAQSIRN